jgi:tetratricopeptide (TPR) repeat protein
LGEAYSQSGNTSKAEAIWKGVIKQANSIQASQNLANLYLEQEDYASAASQMQNLLSLNPADVKLYYQVGLLYAATDPVKALPYFAQAIDIDPSNASKAQDLYDKIRTATLFNQPAYTLLASGRKLADMSEWALAAGAFKQATAIDPGYADAWAFLGEAEQQIVIKEAGLSSEVGLAELERALQLDPHSALANTFMGLYWERQQDFTQANTSLDQAIAITPEDPYLYTEQGNILSKAGDLPAAQAAYEKAIQLAPKEALFYRLLAEFALENQIQIHELALPRARQAVMLNPDDPASLDLMAKVMIALQDYYSAKNYAQAAINTDPGFDPAYLHLGTAYLYLNESVLARQWLDKASKLNPSSWSAAQAKRMIEYYFP